MPSLRYDHRTSHIWSTLPPIAISPRPNFPPLMTPRPSERRWRRNDSATGPVALSRIILSVITRQPRPSSAERDDHIEQGVGAVDAPQHEGHDAEHEGDDSGRPQ